MRTVALLALLVSLLQSQTSSLRIVVLEGEGAVNIIQQKTAVRPLIEVRDRNNVPVTGATVTFTIGGGQPAAFAGGVQTLTVTTNAAGQAAAGGFNVLGPGAIQVQVQAAYQGQLATAAISQTNFATAAAASQTGAATGAGGGTSGTTGAASGAAGGGGGISGTTIGIVGAAVAGGAVVATQVAGRDEGNGGSEGTEYTGTFSGQFVYNTVTSSPGGTTTCVSTRSVNGTLKITLRNGNTDGRAELSGTRQEISFSGGSSCSPQPGTLSLSANEAVTGGPSNLTFVSASSGTGPTPGGGGSVTVTDTIRFLGSLSGGVITGTLSFESLGRGTNVFNGVTSTIENSGSASFPVTLR